MSVSFEDMLPVTTPSKACNTLWYLLRWQPAPAPACYGPDPVLVRSPKLSMLALPFVAFLPVIYGSEALAQCGSMPVNPEQAQGIVFIDDNANDIFDNGERGLPGVSVSNGCEVVQTDAAGRYEIPLAPTQILFISQPSGYRVPLDEYHLPRFHYRHYPDGTPEQIDGTSVTWRFPVIGATGPLPESIDFPLTPIESDGDLKFDACAFADPQARSQLDQDKLREDLVTTLIGNPFDAAFGLTVGDVVFDNLDLYERHKTMIALLDIPQ